jgi:hypothetical protein
MTNFKNNLKVGQRVKFYRTHDKATELVGSITRVHPGDDDLVDVKTEPGKGSISRTETAHAADVTVVQESASEQRFGGTPGNTDSRTRNAAGQLNDGGTADSTDPNAINTHSGQQSRGSHRIG